MIAIFTVGIGFALRPAAAQTADRADGRSGMIEEAVADLGEVVEEFDEATDRATDVVGSPVDEELRQTQSQFTVYFENDLFSGNDQDYTNGTRLSWLSKNIPADLHPGLSSKLRDTLGYGFEDRDDIRLNYGFSLQQLMFTPTDISVAELTPDDRPYAGWTALGVSFHAKTLNAIRSLELSLGVVGESSYAEDIQDWVHDVRDIPKAQGWGNQLRDEPAINLFFDSQHRFRTDRFAIPGLEWDFIPRHGIALGNVMTAADVGMTVRAGWNLPEIFGNQKLGPTAYNQEVFYGDQGRKIRQGKFSFYLFGGANAQAKAWDITLDGNTYQDSHSVDKKYFVGELEAGFGLRIYNTHIIYTQTFRSEEFNGQQENPEFGSVAVTIPF